MITVENKSTALVYGPPPTTTGQAVKFHPGENKVSDEYWGFCLQHRNFVADCLKTDIIVGPKETSAPDVRYATSEAEAIKNLHQLENLGGLSVTDSGRAVGLIDDRNLLAKWARAENRDEVTTLIVGKLARLTAEGADDIE